MTDEHLDMRTVINGEKFQQLQDDIADITGLALLTVDFRGIPVTRHSRCCEFCTLIRREPEYRKLCEKSDSRGGLEAARLKKPYIYLCHMGLVDFAVPIIIEENYLGAIMAGQVFVGDSNKESNLERVYYDRIHLKVLEDDLPLKKLYFSLPVMSLDKIETVAKLILHFSTFIIEEAVLRTSFHNLSSKIGHIAVMESPGPHNRKRTAIDSRIIPSYKERYTGNKVLTPAMDYLHAHPREKVNIAKMASLCNLSTGHFSKLFKKELKVTFSGYVNGIKAEASKELLEISTMQVSEIAYHMGYEDCSYFIKVFKKHSVYTPTQYRRQYRLSKHTITTP